METKKYCFYALRENILLENQTKCDKNKALLMIYNHRFRHAKTIFNNFRNRLIQLPSNV